MAEMTGARYLAELLVGYGIKSIFFKPSILSKMLAQMDDLPIRRVLTHGEKAAAYMADGYARASRGPGICGAQAIGAANLAAGLRDAYMSHSPVISLTGGRFGSYKHKRVYQEIDDYPMFVPVTKANFQVDEAGRIPDLMRQAFREATTGTPGPVNLQFLGKHGEIENDLIDMEMIIEREYTYLPPHRPDPERERIKAAAIRLKKAKRPVIIAGGGTRTSGAGKELLELAEKLSIPVATSTGAFSLVPEHHPLYIGVPGTYSRAYSNDLILKADLALVVGSELGGQLTHYWRVPPHGIEIIQISIDPSDLGRTYPNSVSLLGDAKKTLQALIEALEPGEPDSWVHEIQKRVKDWRAEVNPVRNSSAVPMRPERIMKELSECLPDNVLLVCDTGHSPMWVAQHFWKDSTDWDYIRCAGSLGWAFPASLGAKCALPDHPVVCFTGDGGFWYHMQELETAVRCGIHSVTVVNNNNSLNQERNLFMNAYEGNPSNQWGQMWQFTEVNFSKIAQEMGAVGIRVEEPADISPALKKALACEKPALIEVMSDMTAMAVQARL
jgi:acetolactate synthase-1/2/3 large subunit